MDPSKLTPAPWKQLWSLDDAERWPILCDSLNMPMGIGFDDDLPEHAELIKFIALARNAFAFWYEREPETAMKWLTDTETWYREAE